ncbi:MAG: hypothetical protein JSS35_04800, partial [Proteobacteria bacterium]|nr:hypothetical protein [Pseudomonadota bacterium]
AEDIAELALRNPYDKGGYEVTTTVVDDTAAGAARQWGLQKGVEIRNCSFALMVRRKSISTPVLLAQGLTWNTGRALADDVRAVLATGA